MAGGIRQDLKLLYLSLNDLFENRLNGRGHPVGLENL